MATVTSLSRGRGGRMHRLVRSVDVDSRAAVDAAHAEAVRAGHEVIYGPIDEPWGVRRFFVGDPHGVVISVLAHE